MPPHQKSDRSKLMLRSSIEWQLYCAGSHRLRCPGCGRGKSDKSLGLTINRDRTGVAHCFRCNYVEVFRLDEESKLKLSGEVQRLQTTQKYETLSKYGRELFAETKTLQGIALDYLNARKCVIPPEDGDLRYHPALKHPSGYVGPALVALVTDAVTNQPITLHRTWIERNGKKADVDPSRMLFAGHRKAGGVIRLWSDENVTFGLGVCEGIETSLSLAHAFTPIWSLIDAGNLASFPPLPGIEALMIGADNDEAGAKGARQCGTGWVKAGKQVHIVITRDHSDLNDLAMKP